MLLLVQALASASLSVFVRGSWIHLQVWVAVHIHVDVGGQPLFFITYRVAIVNVDRKMNMKAKN